MEDPGYSEILWLILLVGYVGRWLWMRSRSGSILLDLGRAGRTNSWLILGGVLVIFGAVSLTMSVLDGETTTGEAFVHLAPLAAGMMCVIHGFGGLQGIQFRDVGILDAERLVRWDRIESWVWTETDRDLTLQVVGKGAIRFFLWSTVRWKIPIRSRDVVERLLAEHVSSPHKPDTGK